jgi:hypothetical protein
MSENDRNGGAAEEQRREDRLREVSDADDTGMVSQESEVVTDEVLASLRKALPPEHEAHDTIDALGRELSAEKPSRDAIEQHVHRLRGWRELEAIVVNWWDDPRTQRIISDLGQIGL